MRFEIDVCLVVGPPNTVIQILLRSDTLGTGYWLKIGKIVISPSFLWGSCRHPF